jgi:hypothetical protein
LSSLHLIRQGLTEEQSVPTIIISTKLGASDTDKESLRKTISYLFKESARSQLRMQFEEESLRRTTKDGLPPICKARNTHFKHLLVSDYLLFTTDLKILINRLGAQVSGSVIRIIVRQHLVVT